jgi:hypothetical protein
VLDGDLKIQAENSSGFVIETKKERLFHMK